MDKQIPGAVMRAKPLSGHATNHRLSGNKVLLLAFPQSTNYSQLHRSTNARATAMNAAGSYS
jgi:hypothetical protein